VRPSIWARRRSQHTECKSGDLGASSYRAYMHLVPLAPGSQPLPVSRLCRLSRWPDLAKSTRCGHRTSNDYNRDAGAERSGARRALQLLTIRAGAGVMTTREKNRRGPRGTKSRQAMTRPTLPRSCGGETKACAALRLRSGMRLLAAQRSLRRSASAYRSPSQGAPSPARAFRSGGTVLAQQIPRASRMQVTTRLAYTRSTRQCPGKVGSKTQATGAGG
jgi:hypothetical protein